MQKVGAGGTAVVAWHEVNGGKAAALPSSAVEGCFVMDHAYWGPQFSGEEMGAAGFRGA